MIRSMGGGGATAELVALSAENVTLRRDLAAERTRLRLLLGAIRDAHKMADAAMVTAERIAREVGA